MKVGFCGALSSGLCESKAESQRLELRPDQIPGSLHWTADSSISYWEPREDQASPERGLVTFWTDLHLPLSGPPLRSCDLWHLGPEDQLHFQKSRLSLYANGISVQALDDNGRQSGSPIAVAFSPFSLVQGVRMHSEKADRQMPWLRLFKVSVFHFGWTHIFGTTGDEADAERAQWLAEISRTIRVLTQSLFNNFSLSSQPLRGMECTATRLVGGYLLMCDDADVARIYCELHAHFEGKAVLAVYEDETCEEPLQLAGLTYGIDVDTRVTERVGIDCSCFSISGIHFSARTCAEKNFWLRAINNVKVKLKHGARNPTDEELIGYRDAIREQAQRIDVREVNFTRRPLLPRYPVKQKCKPTRPPENDRMGPQGAPASTLTTESILSITGRSLQPGGAPMLDEDLDAEPPPAESVTL
eukprot:TRINITY_DN111636_c0_g1_i1.p1 TRINITY_DN111636_c0_g1~~TRINITY_DN111636_c0_g1_i1.p1  ORF type:complete len:415 (-),score=67.86 TRINITY_DN111636_c0_g1_i1:58-1302(-)